MGSGQQLSLQAEQLNTYTEWCTTQRKRNCFISKDCPPRSLNETKKPQERQTLLWLTTTLTGFNFMSLTGENQTTQILSFPNFQMLEFAVNFVVDNTASKASWSLHHWWHEIILEILKIYLDTVLGKWLKVALPEQGGWTRWCPEVPSRPNYSVIIPSWWPVHLLGMRIPNGYWNKLVIECNSYWNKNLPV